MKETFETKTLLGVLSTEIYAIASQRREMLPIHYYRCSFNNNSVDHINRDGFCFNERDTDKLRVATSLDDEWFTDLITSHHGVRIVSGPSRVNVHHRTRYVIFHDDSFFKYLNTHSTPVHGSSASSRVASTMLAQLSDEKIILENVMYPKLQYGHYRLSSSISRTRFEHLVKDLYPNKCCKEDDKTLVVYTYSREMDYFFLRFGFSPSCCRGFWAYTKECDTKEDADRLMNILRFYNL